jgi:hypothetical protein
LTKCIFYDNKQGDLVGWPCFLIWGVFTPEVQGKREPRCGASKTSY